MPRFHSLRPTRKYWHLFFFFFFFFDDQTSGISWARMLSKKTVFAFWRWSLQASRAQISFLVQCFDHVTSLPSISSVRRFRETTRPSGVNYCLLEYNYPLLFCFGFSFCFSSEHTLIPDPFFLVVLFHSSWDVWLQIQFLNVLSLWGMLSGCVRACWLVSFCLLAPDNFHVPVLP